MINPDIKADFPIFSEYPSLVYLDSAATTQKPRAVIDSITNFYTKLNANPLRGLYDLSNKATAAYERARHKVAKFIGANDCEIIWTRNTTESINLIARTLGEELKSGDEIVLSVASHHSGLLPWQLAAKKTGSVLIYLEIKADGSLPSGELNKINNKTKIVSIPQVSNVLGSCLPVDEIIKRAHEVGALVLLDGAQSVPHQKIDVKASDIDFFAFSGHKIMGPMGVGVLYGKKELLETLPPFLRGGEMIEYVTREEATWAEIPYRFEAGTGIAADAVALGEAIDYIDSIGLKRIAQHEDELTTLLISGLRDIKRVHVIGSGDPKNHHGIVTFTIDGAHPHDIATLLDADNIAIRAGHHCAQVLHKALGLPATARASLYLYNTTQDIEQLISSVARVIKVLSL